MTTQKNTRRGSDMEGYNRKDTVKIRSLVPTLQRMIYRDSTALPDTGTCVLGAGIAIYGTPKGCRKPRMIVLTSAPFQGNISQQRASIAAMAWLKEQGISFFWYDGIMD